MRLHRKETGSIPVRPTKEGNEMAHIHIDDLNKLLRGHSDWSKYDPDFPLYTPLCIMFAPPKKGQIKRSEIFDANNGKQIVMDYNISGEVTSIEII